MSDPTKVDCLRIDGASCADCADTNALVQMEEARTARAEYKVVMSCKYAAHSHMRSLAVCYSRAPST